MQITNHTKFPKYTIIIFIISIFLISCNGAGNVISGGNTAPPQPNPEITLNTPVKSVALGGSVPVTLKINNPQINQNYPVVLTIKQGNIGNVAFANGESSIIVYLNNTRIESKVYIFEQSLSNLDTLSESRETNFITINAKLPNESNVSSSVKLSVVAPSIIAFSQSVVNLYSTQNSTLQLNYINNPAILEEHLIVVLSVIGPDQTVSLSTNQCTFDTLGSHSCDLTINTTSSSVGKYLVVANAPGYIVTPVQVIVNAPGAFSYDVESVNSLVNQNTNIVLQFNGESLLLESTSITFNDIQNIVIAPQVCNLDSQHLSCSINISSTTPGNYILTGISSNKAFSIPSLSININPQQATLSFTPDVFSSRGSSVSGVSQLTVSGVFNQAFSATLSNNQVCNFNKSGDSCAVSISSSGGMACHPVVNRINVNNSNLPSFVTIKNSLSAYTGYVCG